MAEIKMHVSNNRGMSVPTTMAQTPQGYQFSYVPTDPGTYSIHVTYGGLAVPGLILFRFISAFAVVFESLAVVFLDLCT